MLVLYTFGMRIVDVYQQKLYYDTLIVQKNQLIKETEQLNEQLYLLGNSEEYVIRYARENYVFTRDGELPIQIP
jgi:Septum formation initiator.